MPGNDETGDFATKLAPLVSASRTDFARLFDAEAERQKPGAAAQLHTLIQISRLGAATREEAESDAFAFRVAFRHAESEGWLERFVTQVAVAGMLNVRDKTGKADPQKAAAATDIAKMVRPTGMSFEPQAVVNADDGFPDPITVTREFQLATRRVCEILVDRGDTARGSGFLVGPQVVLTNWHVVKALLPDGGSNPAKDVLDRLKVRFDRVMDDAMPGLGAVVNRGALYSVLGLDVWDPAYPAEYDGAVIGQTATPPWAVAEERLDFALIRLHGAPGIDRGWYELLPDLWPAPKASLYLLQFPGQFAMKITTGAIVQLCDENSRRRVRHRANSDGGSSGGLCLGYDRQTNALKPKAMHQASVKISGGANGEVEVVNQAIPLAKIAPKIREFSRRSDSHGTLSRLSAASGAAFAGAPVFGRGEFQRYIAEAVTGAARIIIVRPQSAPGGSARSVGKTFSERLLRSRLPGDSHHVVTFAASDIPSDARSLAQAILDRAEAPEQGRTPLPEMKDAGTTETAWIADQLIRTAFGPRLEAAARGRLIWLVIDDLDRVDLPDAGGRRFLDALYQNVALVPSLRIILIGLMRDLPSIGSALLRIDRLAGAPGANEIRVWLNQRFGSARKVDDDIVESLTRIALSVAGNGEDQAMALAAAVQHHLDSNLPAEKRMPDGAEA